MVRKMCKIKLVIEELKQISNKVNFLKLIVQFAFIIHQMIVIRLSIVPGTIL